LKNSNAISSPIHRPVVRRKEVDLRLVPLAFLALITIGTVLLMLPMAHRTGQSIRWLDAFFLSTSATCVTGLSTINVADTFNGFGQAVLLVLIQLGGLGIFTASLSLVLLSGQRLSLADEHTISATVGKLRQVRPLDLFAYACVFVLVFELAGAVAMFAQMDELGGESPGQALWEAAFHSVSAFCNAGISIYPEGLVRWKDQPGLLAVIDLQVIAGGIGLMTLINLRYFYFWRKDPRRRGYLTLQTKISLFMAAVLLLMGTALTFAFESNHTMAGATVGERVSWSFFHSAMTRTAGFNTVDLGEASPPTLLVSLALMSIGGAPGSMAGGLKTVTFAVLALTAWTTLRRQENIHVFGRRISRQMSSVAVMLSLLGGAVLMLGIGLLMFTEQTSAATQTSQRWLGVVFEAVSAFGTVGLSTGVTPLLSELGKWVIIALMFTGRVAPLVLSIYLARPPYPWHVRRPREDLGLG
jgi:trk system potassium uptake protein